MHNKNRRIPAWLRFQLWEAIVFMALVAALFGAGQMLSRRVHEFPGAPQVSLAFAKAEIARDNVTSMQLRQVDDLLVGYAELAAPATVADEKESSTQAFVVAMRHSDGSASAVLTLLESHGVPFSLFRSTQLFALSLPLLGTGLLTLAAIFLLRIRHWASRQTTRE